MSRLILFGAGGHGIVAADAASSCRQWQEICFLDDAEKEQQDYLIVGMFDDWQQFLGADTSFFVAIGNNAGREEIEAAVSEKGGPLATIVHDRATVSSLADVRSGTLVCAGAVINPRARVGRGAIVNTGATVDHDCMLGNYVHISPGAHLAGYVVVGDRSWIGIGASVRDGAVIGSDCIIGAGATVLSDVASGQTVVGLPARPMSSA